MQRRLQPRLSAVLLLGLLIVLTSCGGDDSSSDSSDSSNGHNDADVAFATGMVPHHEQAITMAQMAVTMTTNDELMNLANQIQDAQQPEIDTMTGWLESWGEPVPDSGIAGMDHGSGMDDGGMEGMMTPQDMRSLSDASGSAFDQMWLEMMIRHHEGAIEMAQTELDAGESTDAQALAQDIIDAQQAEITTMNGMLR